MRLGVACYRPGRVASCPVCQTQFDGDEQFCPLDGAVLADGAPPDPLTGRVLGGRYRLDDRLGRGGMGTVYRALHTRMDKPVAVKVLRSDLAGDAEATRRFHREARSASRLDHDHCIRVTDFGQSDDGLLFLAMELLEGRPLGAILDDGPLAPPVAAALAHDVALALAHAHDGGVVHRDLKPDNVFVARRPSPRPHTAASSSDRSPHQLRAVVKVLDFGLAKIAGESATGPTITRAGVVFGTPEYMAPEQALGGTLDARSDLYALGALLYHMLVGEPPFRAPSFIALLRRQVEDAPVPPRTARPDAGIPEGLEAVTLRLLAKDPAARYPSGADVAEALAPFADPAALGTGRGPVDLLGPLDAIPPRRPRPPTPMARGVGDEDDSVALAASLDELRGGPRRVALAAVVVVLALASIGVVGARALRSGEDAPPSVETGLSEARRHLGDGDLDRAEALLRSLRARSDGVELQLLMGELEQRRGNRLGALAHAHRATVLAPLEAEPHARLATLLHFIDQPHAACREAHLALTIDPRNDAARAAAEPCGEHP